MIKEFGTVPLKEIRSGRANAYRVKMIQKGVYILSQWESDDYVQLQKRYL